MSGSPRLFANRPRPRTARGRGTQGHACLQGRARAPSRAASNSMGGPDNLLVRVAKRQEEAARAFPNRTCPRSAGTSPSLPLFRPVGTGPADLERLQRLHTSSCGCATRTRSASGPPLLCVEEGARLEARGKRMATRLPFSSSGATDRHANSVVAFLPSHPGAHTPGLPEFPTKTSPRRHGSTGSIIHGIQDPIRAGPINTGSSPA